MLRLDNATKATVPVRAGTPFESRTAEHVPPTPQAADLARDFERNGALTKPLFEALKDGADIQDNRNGKPPGVPISTFVRVGNPGGTKP